MDAKDIRTDERADIASPGFKSFRKFNPEDTQLSGATSSQPNKLDDVFVDAKLVEGETVVLLAQQTQGDLSFVASAVGPDGQVIVITPKTDQDQSKGGYAPTSTANTRYIESTLDAIALGDKTVDAVFGNRVTNLVAPEEIQLVIDEVYRLLKPGGRIALADLLLRKDLEEGVKGVLPTHEAGLQKGTLVTQFESYLRVVGFEDISIVDKKSDINGILGEESPEGELEGHQAQDEGKGGSYRRKVGRFTRSLVGHDDSGDKHGEELDWNDWAGYFQIFAKKPEI